MNIINALALGTIVGVIHFVILGTLYANPFIDKYYKHYQKTSKAVKKWPNQKEYLLKMFLGTQVEVYIMTFGYLYLEQFLSLEPLITAITTGAIFAGIRVYPRFWNMWIQSNYPMPLLMIELVNGTISTFVVTVSLAVLYMLF